MWGGVGGGVLNACLNTEQRYAHRSTIYGPWSVYKKQCSLAQKTGKVRTRRIVSMREAVFWNNICLDKDVSPQQEAQMATYSYNQIRK